MAVGALLALHAGCRPAPQNAQALPPGALRGSNVLLVTIDTLRADRLGVYGSRLGLTPTLDRLAREGIVFEKVYAHVPLTLPSHTTIMTGTYPTTNGVRDNGSFRFDGKRPTLASALKAEGYATAAFVGAFPVDARFGLNAGFDLYDDNYGSRPSGGELSILERPATQVLTAATDWIFRARDPQPPALSPEPSREPSALSPKPSPKPSPEPSALSPKPFFIWVHLYDPHDPYSPPEPFRSRYASDLYSGEIAYTDSALGDMFDRLNRTGSLANTIVAIMADHGESLGEHGERTHGLFAYDATLRVPLIIWHASGIRNHIVSNAVRLVDVMPTLLDLVGVALPERLDGRSLRTLTADTTKTADPPSYFEALNANLTRSWAPLTGVVQGGFKLIDLPIPELYDLSADPGELQNVYARKPDVARPLERQLDSFAATAVKPQAGPVDRETEQRLRSLGYVVAPAARPEHAYSARDDPKTLVALQNQLDAALDALKQGNGNRAETLLKEIIQQRPDFIVAYERLAFIYHETGRPDIAIATLEAASRVRTPDAELLATLGGYLQEANQLQRSAQVLEAAVNLNQSEVDAHEKLAVTYTRMRRFADAEREFRYVLSVDPSSPITYNNLGSLFLSQNRDADAIKALSQAIALDPALANAHNGLGVAYARTGNVDRAITEWRKALELRPDLADARANLDRVGAR